MNYLRNLTPYVLQHFPSLIKLILLKTDIGSTYNNNFSHFTHNNTGYCN